MFHINPYNTPFQKVHQIILGSVAPRPIAFASTVDKDGNPNLSPFSFFNAFGVNPTTLIFSPSRRGRDNTTKNTYDNLKEVPEVVINAVTYSIVQQASLASTEYPKGVNEFIKAGLTPVPSEKVKPFRVKESPVQFECKVRQIIETGDQGGAANLIICEILLIHIDETVFDEKGNIDLNKIDLVGRMGGDYYVRASGDALFTVEKPLQKLGIGIDALPEKIKHSPYLSGNDLGQLGNLESLPAKPEIDEFNSTDYKGRYKNEKELAEAARKLLSKNKVAEALKLLMGNH
jgi:flavin reductase (DIM6/NTAB) family NADH-FMN oxidoreductase RutF